MEIAGGGCYSGWDVQTTPRRSGQFLLSSVNGFLDQAKADMRNRGVHAMLCPV
jgi:hypothetical protein